jgi:uncharacterized protein YkwD
VLEHSSDRFAERLADTGRFAHDARIRVPSGRFTHVGEALAQGHPRLSPAEAVRAWMDSPPHRRLVLSTTFTHAGAGVAREGATTVRVLHVATPKRGAAS